MIQWFSTLYSNANSCIISNGHTSEYFPIKRGVRQGDPLSGSLFVLAVELLANALRKNKDIKGITFNDKIILLNQYADDTNTLYHSVKSSSKATQSSLIGDTVHNTGISLLLSTSVWVILSPSIER